MTKSQAQRMMEDLGENLVESDYCHDIYISTKLAGSKSYRECAYFEIENYIFVWNRESSELISRKESGDYIIVPNKRDTVITLKKVT